MTPETIKSRRLFSVFLLGCLIFNYPIVSLFNHEIFIFGIPVLFVYLFWVWGLFIATTIFITHTHPKSQLTPDDEPKTGQKEPDFPYPLDKGPSC